MIAAYMLPLDVTQWGWIAGFFAVTLVFIILAMRAAGRLGGYKQKPWKPLWLKWLFFGGAITTAILYTVIAVIQ